MPYTGHNIRANTCLQIITRLGGVWDQRPHFSLECTHVVIGGSPTRSEKFLAACASGRWVLRPEYLEASTRAGQSLEGNHGSSVEMTTLAGKFVDEEPYEICEQVTPSRSQASNTLASVCFDSSTHENDLKLFFYVDRHRVVGDSSCLQIPARLITQNNQTTI